MSGPRKNIHSHDVADWVNDQTRGALDSDNYRVYINEYGYPMVEEIMPERSRTARTADWLAVLLGYIIGLSIMGTAAFALFYLFVKTVYYVSRALFGGS